MGWLKTAPCALLLSAVSKVGLLRRTRRSIQDWHARVGEWPQSSYAVRVIPTPAPVEDLAVAALDYVQRATGMQLDFREETLPVLDHYARTVRSEAERNPSLVALVAPALGAYFGELARAALGGFWRVPSANQHDWAVCLEATFLAFNPIGVAYDAIVGSSEHEGPRSALRIAPEDQEYLEQRLAAIPPVPEDEYFLFSTRLEVLHVAVEALSAKMQEEGYGGTEYSADDYSLEYGGPEQH